ncbi:MAG: hypothetical protein RIR36_519, partial [Bacteroidota bacterium]
EEMKQIMITDTIMIINSLSSLPPKKEQINRLILEIFYR